MKSILIRGKDENDSTVFDGDSIKEITIRNDEHKNQITTWTLTFDELWSLLERGSATPVDHAAKIEIEQLKEANRQLTEKRDDIAVQRDNALKSVDALKITIEKLCDAMQKQSPRYVCVANGTCRNQHLPSPVNCKLVCGNTCLCLRELKRP